jgi:hypothetical protein
VANARCRLQRGISAAGSATWRNKTLKSTPSGPARCPDRPRVRQIVRAAIAFESDGLGHATRCGFSAVMFCLRLDPSPVRQDMFAGESGLTRRQTGCPVKRCGWVRTLLGSFAAPAYFNTGERLGKTQLSPRKKAEGAGEKNAPERETAASQRPGESTRWQHAVRPCAGHSRCARRSPGEGRVKRSSLLSHPRRQPPACR